MKVVLSNRIFMNHTPELMRIIKQELTHTIPPTHSDGKSEVICTYMMHPGTVVSIPIGRTDLIPSDATIVDKRVTNDIKISSKVVKDLRPSQLEAYTKISDNYLLNAKPGWGKTYTALALVEKLQQKTLVVVHTTFLRDQWIKECERLMGFSPGVIGSGSFNINSPITIANIQTLNKRMDELIKEFGLIIVDECHHVPANTFKNVLDKSKARYKIGLSGTLERKDKKNILLHDYIGFDVISPKEENIMTPVINIIKTDIELDPKENSWAKKINTLKQDPTYINLILGLISSYIHIGHKILVVSDRVAFLNLLHENSSNSICITGATKNREELIKKVYTPEISTIFGSISIFKEGININNLSCLVLATPVNNNPLLEQLIGRIMRKYENKLTPIVVDISLKGGTARNQAKERMGYYLTRGYQINYI